MVEQSYIFDFSRVPSFFEYFNVAFFVDEMYQTIDGESTGTGSNCYELVWCSYGDGNNISDYLFFRSAKTADVSQFISWVNVGGNVFYKK